MTVTYTRTFPAPRLVFDLVDGFLRGRGLPTDRPRPRGAVRCLALASVAADGTRQPFAAPVELVMQRTASGYFVFLGTVQTPVGPRQGFLDGAYLVRLETEFYQPVEQVVTWRDPAVTVVEVELQPNPAYPFPSLFGTPRRPGVDPCDDNTLPPAKGPTLLRGSLHRPDGRPVANARVEAPGQAPACLTDAGGQWVLVFPTGQRTGRVDVRVTWPDGTVDTVDGVCVVQGREVGLAQTALRGWVQTVAGAPIAGAEVGVDGFPDAAHTGRDGSWFLYFGLNQPSATVRVTARLPDGRSLTQDGVLVQPRASVVTPSFRFGPPERAIAPITEAAADTTAEAQTVAPPAPDKPRPRRRRKKDGT